MIQPDPSPPADADPAPTAASDGADADAPRPRRARRVALALAAALSSVLLFLAISPLLTRGPGRLAPPVERLEQGAAPVGNPHLRIASVNLAHGRADGFHQLLTSESQTRANLDAVAAVLRREAPDVVCLQEADGPSLWSGSFDHVAHLAAAAGYGERVRGRHVAGLDLDYGAALMSRLPLRDPVSVTFAPTWPTFTKGFVVSTVAWPGRPDREVDVVSVHLDFASAAARRQQTEQLAAELAARPDRPRIVVGDFNCEWDAEGGTLRELAERLELHTFEPEATSVVTFPPLDVRIDWILVSRSIRFVEHEVLDDVISDHRAVLAVLELGS